MLFRHPPARAVLLGRSSDLLPGNPLSSQRPLHSSRSLRDDPRPTNHYDTLNIHPEASPAEIKKSFYALSKAHHPDHNRTDPHAGRRFARISEAYSVLGHAEKRARYDRDVMHRHQHHHHHRQHRGGSPPSYHSTGPAGGRPASGLSRRRGTFTGPPPSFFRSGGYGSTGPRRAAGAAHEGPGGGMGPGQARRGEVPHFDREAHERTQRRNDERRLRKLAEDNEINLGSGTGMATGFLVVSGVLATAVLLPFLVLGGLSDGKRKEGGSPR